MFYLVFVFTGLCGFALDPPPAQDASAEGLDVVLVKAPRHAPMLVVHNEAVAEGTTLPVSETYGDYVGFSLRGQIVRLRNRSGSGEEHVTWDALEGEPECPQQGNARSYGWLVPMSRVTPGEGQVLTGYRQPPRQPPEPFEAVLQLESGYLSNLGFARDDRGEVIRWEFDRGPWRSAIRTALGDPIELRQEGWTEQVELEFVNVRTRVAHDLILEAAGDGEDRLIEIFNVPGEEICCTRPQPEVEENKHFPYLYDLLPSDAVRSVPTVSEEHCQDPGPDQAVPLSCRRPCGPPAYGNPQCPGADMSRP